MTGPVYVEGAKEGDCLAVEILEVTPGLAFQGGYTSIQSGVGVLEDILGTFQEPLEAKTRQFASSVSKITVSPDCMVTAGGVFFS